MEAEVIEKLECEVDSSLMKLNKDQLIEIAAGISLDKKYEDKSKLTVLKNIRKYIDGQEDTLKYELLSKLQKVLDTEYSITEPAVKVKEEVVNEQNEEEANKVNNIELKVEVPKTEIDDVSKIKPVYVAREFKIRGVISNQGKNSLSYISLMRQIKAGEAKGIPPSEIMYAILEAVDPNTNLRIYLDKLPNLDLTQVRQIIRDHYREKTTSDMYQELVNMVQKPEEDPLDFLMQALGVRQKICYCSEDDESIKYNDSLIQGVFLQTIGTGLSNENICAHMKPFLKQLGITDPELIHQMKIATRFEEERARKQCQPTSRKGARVSHVQANKPSESKDPNQKLIDAIESLTAKVSEISSIKSDVEGLKLQMAEITNQSSKPAKTRENAKPLNRRIGCKDCLENNIAPCKHCFNCGKENHTAKECRQPKSDQGNLKGLTPKGRR